VLTGIDTTPSPASRAAAVNRGRPAPNQGRLPPVTGTSRIGLPPASPACCDRPAVAVSHPHSNNQRLTAHASVAQVEFSRAICSTSVRMGCGMGGGLIVVLGRSSGGQQVGHANEQGSRRDKPQSAQLYGQQPAQRAEDRRSTQSARGGGLRRRSTATSCRSIRISTSLAASDRASSASRLRPRASTRYASRRATVSDHAGPPVRWNREVGWKRRR
jgi:hypothetical protein